MTHNAKEVFSSAVRKDFYSFLDEVEGGVVVKVKHRPVGQTEPRVRAVLISSDLYEEMLKVYKECDRPTPQ